MAKIENMEIEVEDKVSYIEKCSYYKHLQDAVSKIVKFISPRYMVELGCGNGNTAVRLAMENTKTSIVAMEIVKDRLAAGANSAKKRKVRNVTFIQGDFTNFSNMNLKNTELVMMMYSFAWIEDPLTNKIEFLKGLYDHLAEGAYLLIADTFLLSDRGMEKEMLDRLFRIRSKEAKESSFWNEISGLSQEEIAKAELCVARADKNEAQAHKEASTRQGRCFVDRKWLIKAAKQAGFQMVLSRDVNALNDGIVLLKK